MVLIVTAMIRKKKELLIDEWDNGFYAKTCPYHIEISENKYCCVYMGKTSTDTAAGVVY